MPRSKSPEEIEVSLWRRLDQRVDRTGGPDACWPYMGSRTTAGYGSIGKGSAITLYTHRLALSRKLGRDLTQGEVACHTCDNPPCCNPAHLFVGSAADNRADAVAKGRLRKATCKRGHDRSPENVKTFMTASGHVRIYCMACDRMRKRMGRGVRRIPTA